MQKSRLGAVARLVAVLVAFTSLGALAGLSSAQSVPVACHQRLGLGGTIVLTADLVCSPTTDQDYALVVLGPVTVDLNGHTVRCVDGLRFGVKVGSNVKLRNGAVAGCNEGVVTDGVRNTLERLTLSHNDVGLSVEGGVRNTLTAILADHNRVGFRLTDGSDGNLLSGSAATENADAGFVVDDGQRNVLSGNHASGNGRGFVIGSGESRTQLTGNSADDNADEGFVVNLSESVVLKGNRAASNGGDGYQIFQSTRTQVVGNEARGNLGNGFFVSASRNDSEDVNLLQRNVAIANGMNGIAIDVTSTRNRITGNTATGQTAPFFDLLDLNPNCRRPPNTWTGNTFVTRSPDCLR